MSKQRIVILDDDTNICDMIRIQLEMAGFDPMCTYNGKEAIAAVREHQPSLMLLDVMLPEMDGLEVLREVRRFTNLPIIMVTARGDEFDRVLGLEMGRG